jgi:hypothetical protein
MRALLQRTVGTAKGAGAAGAFGLAWTLAFVLFRSLFLVGTSWFPPAGVLQFGLGLGALLSIYRLVGPKSVVMRLLTPLPLLFLLARLIYGNTAEGTPLGWVFMGAALVAGAVAEVVYRRVPETAPQKSEIMGYLLLSSLAWLLIVGGGYATLDTIQPSPDGAYAARILVVNGKVSFWITPRWNFLRLDSSLMMGCNPEKTRLEWRTSRHLILHGTDAPKVLHYGSVRVEARP